MERVQPVSNTAHLREGMRAGDLEHTVLSTISVDEFVSKVDDSALVIGFYVEDEDAAADLARFIQRTAVQILDTDVSPAPDTEGRYLVFVEMLPTEDFGQNVAALCKEVSALTNVSAWKMHMRGSESAVPLSAQVLNAKFRPVDRQDRALKGETKPSAKVDEAVIRAFLYDSLLEGIEFDDNFVAFDLGYGNRAVFEVADFDKPEFLLARLGLVDSPVAQDLYNMSRTQRISEGLGDNWWCHCIGDYDVIGRDDNAFVLALRG